MFGIELPPEVIEGAMIVGAVFVQALVLYVGYGELERLLAPKLAKLVEGEP